MVAKVFHPSRQIVPISDAIRERYKIESNKKKSRYVHILLSSAGGQGKTAFIGTASRCVTIDGVDTLPYNNLLLIQYDPLGEDTLYDMKAGFDLVTPRSEKELLDVISFINSSQADQYDVVALDAYHKMQEIESDAVLKVGITKTQLSHRTTKHDEEILELQDYNRLHKRCNAINDKLISIKKHLIITCIKSLKDDPRDLSKKKEDRKQIISLSLDGKMAHLLSTQFSLHGIMSRTGGGDNIHVETDFTTYKLQRNRTFAFRIIHQS
jgi:hypothetical protein